MRKLTGAVFVSLDGVMQAPGGPEEDPTGGFDHGGWVAPFWAEDMGPFEKLIESDYDLLLARRTYDIFAGYWPYNQDQPIGEKFQHINKYVLTHSDQPLTWENSSKLSGDTAEAVAFRSCSATASAYSTDRKSPARSSLPITSCRRRASRCRRTSRQATYGPARSRRRNHHPKSGRDARRCRRRIAGDR